MCRCAAPRCKLRAVLTDATRPTQCIVAKHQGAQLLQAAGRGAGVSRGVGTDSIPRALSSFLSCKSVKLP